MSPVTQRFNVIFCPQIICYWVKFLLSLQYQAVLWGNAEVLSVKSEVEGDEEEGEHGTGLQLGEGTGLGDRLGWQLLSSVSVSSLPPPLPSPPPPPPPIPPTGPCPSSPSEFSSISWMRGGMEPGISIFSVITLSAPMSKRWRGKVKANKSSQYVWICSYHPAHYT